MIHTTWKCGTACIGQVTLYFRNRRGGALLRYKQKSRRNHRSYVWTEALSGVLLRVPAKELSGKVWTYKSGNDPCSWMLNFLTRELLLRWNCLHDCHHNYHEKFRERDLKTFGKRVTSTSKNQHAHTHIPIDATSKKRKEQASYFLE